MVSGASRSVRSTAVICGAPTCTNPPAPGQQFCFSCIRQWSRKALRKPNETGAKLYAISGAELVKFGITERSVRERLVVLQSGSPVKLILLGFIECAAHWERSVHQCLREAHSHGEWFRRTEQVAQVVKWIEAKDRQSIRDWLDSTLSIASAGMSLG
jgi:hypothetical protein